MARARFGATGAGRLMPRARELRSRASDPGDQSPWPARVASAVQFNRLYPEYPPRLRRRLSRSFPGGYSGYNPLRSAAESVKEETHV
jgi:hypothetical protein